MGKAGLGRSTTRRVFAFKWLAVSGLSLWPAQVWPHEVPELEPGRWSETLSITILSIDGKAITQSPETVQTDTHTDCYDAEDMKNVNRFFGETAKDAGCVNLAIVASRGTLTISGRCTYKGTPVSVTGTGRYAARSFLEVIDMAAKIQGHSFEAKAEMTGTYLRACTSEDAQ